MGLSLMGAGPSGRGGIDAHDVAGLNFWLRADSIAGANGSSVSTWSDESGNANHAVKGSFNAPTVRTNALNSLPVVNFVAGSTQALRAHPPAVAPYSAFVIGRLTGSGNARLLGSIYPDNRNWLLGWWNGLEDVGYAEGFFNGGGTSATTNWRAYSLIGGASTATMYRNGSALDTTANTSSPNGGLALCGYAATTSEELSNGELAEVLLYDHALSTPHRQSVEGYLAHKWGLTADLPADHPYKNTAP